MDLETIKSSVFSGLDKANPHSHDGLTLGRVGEQNWNLLRGSLPLPQAVLKGSAVTHNAGWMSDFLKETGACLAPHGKTTMCPQLFALQLDSGAWGITVATVKQLTVCLRFGVKRVLLANQLVGAYEMEFVTNALLQDPDFQFFCLVDSLENATQLARQAEAVGVSLNLLLEVGVVGGRTGCRDAESAMELARFIKSWDPHLKLAGIECYEGLFVSGDAKKDEAAVSKLLDEVLSVALACEEEGLFSRETVILSAGGSAYFDMVARHWEETGLKRPVEVVVRSGCYLTHDSKFYNDLFHLLQERIPEGWQRHGSLKPALEVWSYVQSRPEPDLAILTMGKRDCSYDVTLPKPQQHFGPGRHSQPVALGKGYAIKVMNDQHAYLSLPPGQDIRVGDMISCGISHPCTTFDKWQTLLVVDDAYNVTSAVKTFF